MNNDDINGLYHYAIVCQEVAKKYQKDNDDKAMNDFLLEALNKLEMVIDLDPEFALGYYHLGYHYYNQGQYVKSKVIWEEALKLGLDEDTTSEVQENIGKMDLRFNMKKDIIQYSKEEMKKDQKSYYLQKKIIQIGGIYCS